MSSGRPIKEITPHRQSAADARRQADLTEKTTQQAFLIKNAKPPAKLGVSASNLRRLLRDLHAQAVAQQTDKPKVLKWGLAKAMEISVTPDRNMRDFSRRL